jgi:hypothetical protein
MFIEKADKFEKKRHFLCCFFERVPVHRGATREEEEAGKGREKESILTCPQAELSSATASKEVHTEKKDLYLHIYICLRAYLTHFFAQRVTASCSHAQRVEKALHNAAIPTLQHTQYLSPLRTYDGMRLQTRLSVHGGHP